MIKITNKEDLDDFMDQIFEENKIQSHKNAIAALSYLREKGHTLELVRPGTYEMEGIIGCRAHFNFKARR